VRREKKRLGFGGAGSQPLGPAAILAQHPFGQPVKTKRSFAPRVHAFSREVRRAMVEAYS